MLKQNGVKQGLDVLVNKIFVPYALDSYFCSSNHNKLLSASYESPFFACFITLFTGCLVGMHISYQQLPLLYVPGPRCGPRPAGRLHSTRNRLFFS